MNLLFVKYLTKHVFGHFLQVSKNRSHLITRNRDITDYKSHYSHSPTSYKFKNIHVDPKDESTVGMLAVVDKTSIRSFSRSFPVQ